MDTNRVNSGFFSMNINKIDIKGHGVSVKSGQYTKSFRISYNKMFDVCVPMYTLNRSMNQFRISRNHRFFVVVKRKLSRLLGTSQGGVGMTATELSSLISQIEHIRNIKKSISKRVIASKLFTGFNNKIERINESLGTFLRKMYVKNNLKEISYRPLF